MEDIFKHGIFKYKITFSSPDKAVITELYKLLQYNQAVDNTSVVILSKEEYKKLSTGIKDTRNILLKSSEEQQSALKTFFILLILMISLIMLILVNIINSKEREAQAHKYTTKLAESVAKMENNIQNLFSFELHDDIGQMLVFLKYRLADNDPEASKDVDLIIDKVRTLSYNMRIPDFSNGQLAVRLEEFISRFSVLSPIKVEYNLSNFHEELYPDHYPIMIFRIIQESLQNALKHSKADLIRINLIESDPFIIYQYRDNGIGIDKNARNSHTILKSIEKRAELLNASMQINTEINKGLHIMIKIPFTEGY